MSVLVYRLLKFLILLKVSSECKNFEICNFFMSYTHTQPARCTFFSTTCKVTYTPIEFKKLYSIWWIGKILYPRSMETQSGNSASAYFSADGRAIKPPQLNSQQSRPPLFCWPRQPASGERGRPPTTAERLWRSHSKAPDFVTGCNTSARSLQGCVCVKGVWRKTCTRT